MNVSILRSMRDELEKIAVAKIADNYVLGLLEKVAYSPRKARPRPVVKDGTKNPKPHPGGKAFDMPKAPGNYGSKGGALGTGIQNKIQAKHQKAKAVATNRQSRYMDSSKPVGMRGPGELLQGSMLSPPLSGTKTTPGGYSQPTRVVGKSAPNVLNRPTGPTHTPVRAGPHPWSKNLSLVSKLKLKIPKMPTPPSPNATSAAGPNSLMRARTPMYPNSGITRPAKPPATPRAPRAGQKFNPFGQKNTGVLPFSPTGQGNLFRMNF